MHEDPTIMRWGFVSFVVIGSLLVAMAVCWLHEHEIYVLRSALRFLHRPIGEVLVVMVCVGGLVQHGATKGFFGSPRMMAPREMQIELVSGPETVEASVGLFPTYTNAVTNVCATGIKAAETSVFLRAHWPWNLYPAPTGIEVYGAPELSTNAWVGVGTAPVTGGGNSMVIELPYSLLPDEWASSMFFTLGLNADTDQDGLSDAFERIVSRTDPDLADTDGDAMPDGWEYNNGLDPRSAVADDGASADPDGDGIPNVDEMDYGTDPQKRDSDGDGIDDLCELGSVCQLDDFVWYDTSGGVDILASEVDSSIDDKVWTADLHYPTVIGGKVYDRLTIDSNALVYLIPSNGVAVSRYNRSHQWLPADSLALTNIAVAVNWRDMEADKDNGAEIRVAGISSNHCNVVEFVNLQRYGVSADTMTAQVIIPGGTNETVFVSYWSVSDNLDGRSATVGLMDSTSRDFANTNRFYALQWSYDESGGIASKMTLAYRVGTGTNPLTKDTDGDGLDDGEEVFDTKTDPCLPDTDGDGLTDDDEIARLTDPLSSDTDGDGMPDGWEVSFGFDPKIADGALDADLDGLENLREYQNGTDPHDDDTDGDGLVDSREVAWIEDGTNAVPWFSMVPLKTIETTGDLDYGLYSCELPFTNWIVGGLVDVAVADVNGVVYFGNSTITNDLSSYNSPSDLNYDCGRRCSLVAGYWSDLEMRTSLASKIKFGTASYGEESYFVVQYENVGTYYGSAANRITFQISICASTPDVVYVRYGDVIDTRDSGSVSIGAQGGVDDYWDNHPRMCHAYWQTPQPISNGKTLVFNFGCGGDPFEVDTDGDGVSDVDEVRIGTNPRREDSDGDDLDDGWEVAYGLDPLSVIGRDGADGDFDGDGVSNLRECEYGTNPAFPDTDGDGLTDGEEVGMIVETNALPWLSFDSVTDLTGAFPSENWSAAQWNLPVPLRIQGVLVTNMTMDVNGVFYLNRAGFAGPSYSRSPYDLDYSTVEENALVLAPFWMSGLFISPEEPNATRIRAGTTTHDGEGYILVEYDNVYYTRSSWSTNAVSFQLAIPTNTVDHAFVRIGNLRGEDMDGRYASIGMQSMGGEWTCSCGYYEEGRVQSGHGFAFRLAKNSNPRSKDTDNDGLEDAQEVAIGTNLLNADTDGDGMSDGWEVQYGFNPRVAADADGDADSDGVDNLTESLLGSNPRSEDTDGDGLTDAEEIEEGTSLTSIDTDCDGLEDGFELTIDTNPLQPDTDGDGMDDGWEWTYCRRARMPRFLAEGGRSTPDFDPAVNNNTDTDPDNDFGADPDGDGLSNGEECENRTHPMNPDTDGDGVTDGDEAGQGSDPSDATDGGRPNSRVALRFTFGDPSGSHSEKYRLEITPVSGQGERPASFSWLNANYGECETRTARLKAGWKYEVRLTWAACNHASDGSYYPNYDYTLSLGQDIPPNVVLDDPGGIFRSDYYGGEYYGASHFPVLDAGAYVYVLGPMRLVPDFDGDGKISQTDENILDDGRIFRFWVNDDKDDASPDGDVARNSKMLDSGNDDIPASGSDGSDDKVNGRRDLVDFTPIRVDATKVLEHLPATIRDKFSFRLRQDDGALNVVWSNLSPSGANSFQTARYTSGFGEGLRSSPQDATTEQVVSGGLPLPSAFENRAKTGDGIFLVEGRHETTSPLVVEAIYENRVVCSNELRLSVTSVEDMYRWLGLRHVCGGQDISGRSTAEPTNLPDRETVGPHYVFVHGYNVNAQSARGWAAEMFKRLWQAGARSKFTAVDWYGDESQFYLPTEGDVSPNYYINVEHAFMTAETLKNACGQLPGNKVMLAHSLGNMLVSAAAKDFNLQYTKYYMLNAAVPMEAYDADAYNTLMVDGAWDDVGNRYRASRFYELFSSFPTDFRSCLSWKGRFAGIQNAVNCYSPTEDVLKNPAEIKVFGMTVGETTGDAWSRQELFKGCAVWYGLNAASFSGTRIEGGWGINTRYAANPLAYVPLSGFNASYYTNCTREDLITHPLFTSFNDDRMMSTNALNVVDYQLRAKMLGDAIPAESFAAGANETGGVSGNYNYQGQVQNGWPRTNGDWRHSDLKNVAYFYVWKLFEKIRKVE